MRSILAPKNRVLVIASALYVLLCGGAALAQLTMTNVGGAGAGGAALVNALLLESGAGNALLLENGTDYICMESGC